MLPIVAIHTIVNTKSIASVPILTKFAPASHCAFPLHVLDKVQTIQRQFDTYTASHIRASQWSHRYMHLSTRQWLTMRPMRRRRYWPPIACASSTQTTAFSHNCRVLIVRMISIAAVRNHCKKKMHIHHRILSFERINCRLTQSLRIRMYSLNGKIYSAINVSPKRL